ncbi:MAG: helix-turn-helix domain-containing protein [Actinomycetota bacterium]|nr:helix-turn-helix domain-containing protein [Actinomycetota bacterium]
MPDDTDRLERLKAALKAHREALDALEDALLAELESHTKHDGAGGHELLSLKEVSQELGMSKGWVYQRIRSGEIPHVKLGHNNKVRREDLQAYLQAQRRESIDE